MTNMIPSLTPILADGWEELIGSLVGLVFLVLWVVGQFAGAKKDKNRPVAAQHAERQPPQRPQRQPPPQPQQKAEPVRAQQGAAAPDPLRDQVEEFLRRAGRQPKPDQPRPGQPRPAPGVPVRQRPAPAKRDEIEVLARDEPTVRREPLAKPIRPIERSAPAAKKSRPTAKRRVVPDRESVAEHVAGHITSSGREMDDHTHRLGQRVVQADEQFDVKLHARFDHEVGTMAERHAQRMKDEQTGPAVATPAALIADMLTHPEGVRQAILLNEILRRPSERWD